MDRPKRQNRLSRIYEGPKVLAPLLAESGCELTVEDIREEFICAVEEGSTAGDIIPLLWDAEPRFAVPEIARRLFGNLFGLWDDVVRAAGVGDTPGAEPGVDAGKPLSLAYVEHAWRVLDGLDDKAVERHRHRFDNVQSEIGTFVFEQLQAVGEVGLEIALDLAFEIWWIADHGRGAEALPRPVRADLERALEAGDLAGSEREPALADLVTATLLEHAADDLRPLPEEDIPAIERALRAVRTALAFGVTTKSD